jgi:putative ABC transport system permease protein
LWPIGYALGKRLSIESEGSGDKAVWRRVIGVAEDVAVTTYRPGEIAIVYVPIGQKSRPSSQFVLINGAADWAATMAALAASLDQRAPERRIGEVFSLGTMRDNLLFRQRAAVVILVSAATLAVCLVIVGTSAVVSLSMAQRMREVAIRVAIGARPSDIRWLVIRESMTLTALGAIGGYAVAAPCYRLLSARISVLPELTLIPALIPAAALICAVLLACYRPARTAASVDPQAVLRQM